MVLKVTEAEAKHGAAAARRPAAGRASRSTIRTSSTATRSRPRLARSATSSRPHTEFRDDRFVAAFDRTPDQPAFFTLAYMVRAVAPGTLRASRRPRSRTCTAPSASAAPPSARSRSRAGSDGRASPDTQRERLRRWLAAGAGVLRLRGGVAGGAALWRFVDQLGPLDLSAAAEALDRRARSRRPAAAALHHGGRPLAPAGRRRRTSIRASSPCCRPTRTAASDRHPGVDPLALLRAAGQLPRARPHRLRRLDADHAGGAPARAARGAHARRQAAPDRARRAARAAALARPRSSTSTSRSRPMAAISRACAPRRSPISARSRSACRFAEAALLVALPQSPETRRPDRFAAGAARAPATACSTAAVARGVLDAAEAGPPSARAGARRRAGRSRCSPPTRPKPRSRQRPDAQGSIGSTIDARLQASLETLAARARRAARTRGSRPRSSSIDNATGEVRAHVGSAGLSRAASAPARRHDARRVRSPGSALKPFIYALAFENGLAHPETLLDDRPSRFGALRAGELRPLLPGHGHGAPGAAAVAQRAGRRAPRRGRARRASLPACGRPGPTIVAAEGGAARARRRRSAASASR